MDPTHGRNRAIWGIELNSFWCAKPTLRWRWKGERRQKAWLCDHMHTKEEMENTYMINRAGLFGSMMLFHSRCLLSSDAISGCKQYGSLSTADLVFSYRKASRGMMKESKHSACNPEVSECLQLPPPTHDISNIWTLKRRKSVYY